MQETVKQDFGITPEIFAIRIEFEPSEFYEIADIRFVAPLHFMPSVDMLRRATVQNRSGKTFGAFQERYAPDSLCAEKRIGETRKRIQTATEIPSQIRFLAGSEARSAAAVT